MFTTMETSLCHGATSGLYRMRFSEQGYSDLVREILLQEDIQLFETTALKLKCVIEWARGRMQLFKVLVGRMCEYLQASTECRECVVSDDSSMSSDEDCRVMGNPSAGRCCSELDSEMNSQHCGAR